MNSRQIINQDKGHKNKTKKWDKNKQVMYRINKVYKRI